MIGHIIYSKCTLQQHRSTFYHRYKTMSGESKQATHFFTSSYYLSEHADYQQRQMRCMLHTTGHVQCRQDNKLHETMTVIVWVPVCMLMYTTSNRSLHHPFIQGLTKHYTEAAPAGRPCMVSMQELNIPTCRTDVTLNQHCSKTRLAAMTHSTACYCAVVANAARAVYRTPSDACMHGDVNRSTG